VASWGIWRGIHRHNNVLHKTAAKAKAKVSVNIALDSSFLQYQKQYKYLLSIKGAKKILTISIFFLYHFGVGAMMTFYT
jgi:hypothetical protein